MGIRTSPHNGRTEGPLLEEVRVRANRRKKSKVHLLRGRSFWGLRATYCGIVGAMKKEDLAEYAKRLTAPPIWIPTDEPMTCKRCGHALTGTWEKR